MARKQKNLLLGLFVANIDLIICLLTLGDWQAGGSDQRGSDNHQEVIELGVS